MQSSQIGISVESFSRRKLLFQTPALKRVYYRVIFIAEPVLSLVVLAKFVWLHVVLVCPLAVLVCPLVVSVCLHIVLIVLFVGFSMTNSNICEQRTRNCV